MKDSPNTTYCNVANKIPSLKKYCTKRQELHLYRSKCCYHYKKDDIIFRENFPLSHIGIVVSGAVGIWKGINLSENHFINFVKKGEFFGFRSIEVQKDVYDYSSIAFVDTTICLLPKEWYLKLFRENHEFHLKIISHYGARLDMVTKDFINQSFMNATQKVANALLKIYGCTKREGDEIPCTLSIPRKLLADISGISLGETIRVVAKFRNKNYISTKSSTITILNLNKLKEIVENVKPLVNCE